MPPARSSLTSVIATSDSGTGSARPKAFLPRFRRAARLVAIAGMACLIGAIVIVVVDVVFRRTLGATVIGTVDLTQLCVMAAAFWSIPFAFASDAHVKVDLATAHLPYRWRSALDGGAALLGLSLLLVLVWTSWGQAMLRLDYGDSSQDLGIPMIIYWAFLLSGCAFSCLSALAVAMARFSEAFGKPTAGPYE